MKKPFLLVMGLMIFSDLTFVEGATLYGGVEYTFGWSDFFKVSEQSILKNESTDIEKIRRRPGFGFDMGAMIPFGRRFSVIPEFGMTFGHQTKEYFSAGDENQSVRTTSYFRLFSGALAVGYNYLCWPSGWNAYVMAGLRYNMIRADQVITVEDRNQLGWQLGLGFHFNDRGGAPLGFHSRITYSNSFGSPKIGLIGLQLGISYNLL